ncbi:MAG: hypothetical protein F6K35_31100, partial [Okeania sp. SIO2H7]|nr:hypothetical protein [Okeania sp. SIO2H7]
MAKRKGKRTTGQITVNLNRGWLRLRFPQKFRDYLEERGEKCPTYLSLFLKEVDPETQVNNWPLAEAIAAAINQDWLSDDRNANLDLTLQKYLGQLHRQPKDQPNYPFAVGRQTWTSANDQVLLK